MSTQPTTFLEELHAWAVLGLMSVAREELDDAKAITTGSTSRAQADIHQPALTGIRKAGVVQALEIRHALEHVEKADALLREALRLAERGE